jgi:hypothetical protein
MDTYIVTEIKNHEAKADGYYFFVQWEGGETSWVHETYLDHGPIIDRYVQQAGLSPQQLVIGLVYFSFSFSFLFTRKLSFTICLTMDLSNHVTSNMTMIDDGKIMILEARK